MRLRAVHLVAGVGLLMMSACASEPQEQPDLSGAVEARQGDEHLDAGAPPRGGRMRPLFISPAGEPFHGAIDGPSPVEAWFAQADADHDGKLSRAEFTADYDRFFKRLDVNADGVIDGFEAQAYERIIAPELLPQVGRLRAGEGQDDRLFKGGGRGGGGMGRGGGRGGRGSRGDGGSGGPGSPRSGSQNAGSYQFFPDLEPITAADANLDGKVTLAEWRLRAQAVFGQLDVKGAGVLTLATLPKTPQQVAIEKRKAADEKRRPR